MRPLYSTRVKSNSVFMFFFWHLNFFMAQLIFQLWAVKRKVKIIMEVSTTGQLKLKSFPVEINTANWSELVAAFLFCSEIISAQIHYYCKGSILPNQIKLYLVDI